MYDCEGQSKVSKFKWHSYNKSIRFINATKWNATSRLSSANRRSKNSFSSHSVPGDRVCVCDPLKFVIKWIDDAQRSYWIESVLCIFFLVRPKILPIRIVINCNLLLNFLRYRPATGHINKCVCMIFVKSTFSAIRNRLVCVCAMCVSFYSHRLHVLRANGFDSICFMYKCNGFELLFSGVFNVLLVTWLRWSLHIMTMESDSFAS